MAFFRKIITLVCISLSVGLGTLHAASSVLPEVVESQLHDDEPFEFLSIKAIYPDIPEDSLLAWDIYSDSFQITTHHQYGYQLYQQPFGENSVRDLLADIRQHQPQDQINPISPLEAQAIVSRLKTLLPDSPAWLNEKLASQDTVVATFGYSDTVFAIVAQAVAQPHTMNGEIIFSIEDVHRVIETFFEYTDEMFDASGLSPKTLIHALQVASIMEHVGIHTVHYRSTEKEFPTDASFTNWPDTLLSLDFLQGSGLTVSPVSGEAPKTGYVVSLLNHSQIVSAEQFFAEKSGRKLIKEYLHVNARSFLQSGIYLGIWHDLDSNLVFLDLSEVFQDREKAIAAAKERDQIAIYDLSTGTTIPTEGSGGVPTDSVTSGLRFFNIHFLLKQQKLYSSSRTFYLQEAA